MKYGIKEAFRKTRIAETPGHDKITAKMFKPLPEDTLQITREIFKKAMRVVETVELS